MDQVSIRHHLKLMYLLRISFIYYYAIHRASIGNVTGNSYTVKGLPTGKEFEFRVVPYNAAGNGEPSDSTGLIKVQKPIEAPKISQDTPTEVNAILGQPLKIRIPFTGSPPIDVELIKVSL